MLNPDGQAGLVVPGFWSGTPDRQSGQSAASQASTGKVKSGCTGYGLNVTDPALRSTQHANADDLDLVRLEGCNRLPDRAARREDVVDERDPCSGLESRPPPKLSIERAIGHSLSVGCIDTELACHLESQDHAACRRTGNHVDSSVAKQLGEAPANCFCVSRSAEQIELFDVAIAVLTRRQEKMAGLDSADLLQQCDQSLFVGQSQLLGHEVEGQSQDRVETNELGSFQPFDCRRPRSRRR